MRAFPWLARVPQSRWACTIINNEPSKRSALITPRVNPAPAVFGGPYVRCLKPLYLGTSAAAAPDARIYLRWPPGPGRALLPRKCRLVSFICPACYAHGEFNPEVVVGLFAAVFECDASPRPLFSDGEKVWCRYMGWISIIGHAGVIGLFGLYGGAFNVQF